MSRNDTSINILLRWIEGRKSRIEKRLVDVQELHFMFAFLKVSNAVANANNTPVATLEEARKALICKVLIDGCQYLQGSYGSYQKACHKANCRPVAKSVFRRFIGDFFDDWAIAENANIIKISRMADKSPQQRKDKAGRGVRECFAWSDKEVRLPLEDDAKDFLSGLPGFDVPHKRQQK